MSIDTMIGVDLAKSVFQVHGASMNGEVQFQRKLSQRKRCHTRTLTPRSMFCGGRVQTET
nr:hypothetical protein [Shinella zoogloeoides]